MAALTSFTDGLFNFGSVALSIGLFAPSGSPSITSGVSYIADDFTLNRPSKTVEQTNQVDFPSGQKLYAGFVTGSAKLQLAAAATLPPLLFKAFTVTVYDPTNSGSNTAEYFVIDSVGQPFTKDGETKVDITFRKIINTATAVAA